MWTTFTIIFLTQPIFLLGTISDPWNRRPQLSDFGLPAMLPPTDPPVHLQTTTTPEPVFEDPVFDNSLVTNITAQKGNTGHLNCKILNMGVDNPVSWIRKRDMHILSVDGRVFTNDARFGIHHVPDSREWMLQIKYLQQRDEGTYVCQVSTKIGVKSHYFNLHVLVPAAFILGSDEYHTQAGNAISLVCIIENSLDPPQYVFWYHNGNLINYDRVSRISIKTDPGETKEINEYISTYRNHFAIFDEATLTCSQCLKEITIFQMALLYNVHWFTYLYGTKSCPCSVRKCN